ncbi:MAG: Gas vesicle synthesis family protein [Actinoallomurus sp.]|nr:Gas vesicle synthesis family protein [Actinoallomurus sp.]
MPTDRGDRDERTDDVSDSEHQEDDYDEDYDEDYDDEPGANVPPGERGRRGSLELTAQAAAEAGLRLVAGMTGRRAEGITSLVPAEDGWTVEVEVLEDRRVPSSSNVLALYEVQIDREGSLTSYRRTRRYTRGRSNTGEVS